VPARVEPRAGIGACWPDSPALPARKPGLRHRARRPGTDLPRAHGFVFTSVMPNVELRPDRASTAYPWSDAAANHKAKFARAEASEQLERRAQAAFLISSRWAVVAFLPTVRKATSVGKSLRCGRTLPLSQL